MCARYPLARHGNRTSPAGYLAAAWGKSSNMTSLDERLMAELRTLPPGGPVPARELADRLQCTVEEVLAAGNRLEQREQGDEDLVSVSQKTSGEGDDEYYLSRVPLTLNDEPETR
ncbi:hypothetical protein TUM20985_20320 [Mycobacterium antarcticum]|nr:hypothetical protein TUM20985_20320 [Mycolicibacterium sp. TUM20985]